MDFPIGAVRHQELDGLGIPLLLPEHHHPHGMVDPRNADTLGEEPLDLPVDGGFAPTERPQRQLHPLNRFPILAIDGDGAIELQVADVIPTMVVDMVEDVRG